MIDNIDKTVILVVSLLLLVVIVLIIYLFYLMLSRPKAYKKLEDGTNQGNIKKLEGSTDQGRSHGCPFCGSNDFFEWLYTFLICAKCRGLVDYTPFGLKAVMEDASVRFPEILEWWSEDESECTQ